MGAWRGVCLAPAGQPPNGKGAGEGALEDGKCAEGGRERREGKRDDDTKDGVGNERRIVEGRVVPKPGAEDTVEDIDLQRAPAEGGERRWALGGEPENGERADEGGAEREELSGGAREDGGKTPPL